MDVWCSLVDFPRGGEDEPFTSSSANHDVATRKEHSACKVLVLFSDPVSAQGCRTAIR
jgi:hypothetical protein